MVIYRGSDGKPGYHQVDDIHDAVSFVEEMRNQDGVDHARIFRLEEVTFEFKPYYRVEIGNSNSAAVTAAGDTSEDDEDSSVVALAESDDDSDGDDSEEMSDDSSDDEVAADSDDSDDVEEDAGSGARRGLFGR